MLLLVELEKNSGPLSQDDEVDPTTTPLLKNNARELDTVLKNKPSLLEQKKSSKLTFMSKTRLYAHRQASRVNLITPDSPQALPRSHRFAADKRGAQGDVLSSVRSPRVLAPGGGAENVVASATSELQQRLQHLCKKLRKFLWDLDVSASLIGGSEAHSQTVREALHELGLTETDLHRKKARDIVSQEVHDKRYLLFSKVLPNYISTYFFPCQTRNALL